MLKAENLLKLVGTPADHLSDSFAIIYGPEGSGDVLAAIMELKGMKASDIKERMAKMGMERSNVKSPASLARQTTLKDVTKTFDRFFKRS